MKKTKDILRDIFSLKQEKAYLLFFIVSILLVIFAIFVLEFIVNNYDTVFFSTTVFCLLCIIATKLRELDELSFVSMRECIA